MSKSVIIGDGSFRVVKDGIVRLNTDDSHMVVLSRVVGTHSEPARSASRSPQINNNINVSDEFTIASCHPQATHLLGMLVITLAGSSGQYDATVPVTKPYTYMGGTFLYAHAYEWFAGYTFLVSGGLVRLRRRVVTSLEAPDSGTTTLTLRGFSLSYRLRAVRFL